MSDQSQEPSGDARSDANPHHRIRLKGPWTVYWLDPPIADIPSDERRVHMPDSWLSLFGSRAGRAAFTRRFHCPTGLEPGDRVFAVLEGFGGRGRVLIDGTEAGQVDSVAGAAAAVEITHLLAPACRLAIELELTEPPDDARPGGLWGLVCLEIRSGSGGTQPG